MVKRLTMFVIAAVALAVGISVGAPLTTGIVHAQGTDEAEPFAISDDGASEIVVGSVVGQATVRDSHCVVVEPITVGVTVPDGASPLVISWQFDGECRAVVDSIRPAEGSEGRPTDNGHSQRPTPVPSDPTQGDNGLADTNTAESREGWVKMTILEQFGVTATEVNAHLKFWEDDESHTVWGGYDPYARCYHSAFPGWTIEECSSRYFPNGPDYVWIDVSGEFHNTLNIDYAMYAKFYGTAYGFSYTCDLSEGALPIGWKEHCVGGKDSA